VVRSDSTSIRCTTGVDSETMGSLGLELTKSAQSNTSREITRGKKASA
jgi:hypothetical protein